MMTLKEITTQEEWAQVLEDSKENKVLLFKHSTTCPVSFEAWKQYQQYISANENEEIQYVYVKVIESRPASNQIAEDLGVKHESPQAILIHSKEALWNASHWDITKNKLESAVQSY